MIDKDLTDLIEQQAARIAELQSLSENLKQQAQIHAQEARTANSAIAEIYQVVTGGTGEPGNWNGAKPVRDRIAELESAQSSQQGAETFVLRALVAAGHVSQAKVDEAFSIAAKTPGVTHPHATESDRRDAEEPAPSFTSPLTPYGLLVRALRIVAGTTLYDMGKHLGCKPSTLSSVEFGRQHVTDAMLADTAAFFSSKGVPDTLHALRVARSQKPALGGE